MILNICRHLEGDHKILS